jgi:hypothetical protein
MESPSGWAFPFIASIARLCEIEVDHASPTRHRLNPEVTTMPDLDRRRFVGAATATVGASQLGLLALPRRLEAMTGAITATPPDVARQTGTETDIRPFRVSIPEAELVDLRRRIKATKWPEKETVNDESQGVQFATTQKLAHYWATDHDWRKAEASVGCDRVWGRRPSNAT